MPGGDGTGPLGYGPFTGRGMGFCMGYHQPGYLNRPGYGRGLGLRRGFKRGFRYNQRTIPYHVPAYPETDNYDEIKEVDYLKNRAKALEEELNYLKEELRRLEKNEDD